MQKLVSQLKTFARSLSIETPFYRILNVSPSLLVHIMLEISEKTDAQNQISGKQHAAEKTSTRKQEKLSDLNSQNNSIFFF